MSIITNMFCKRRKHNRKDIDRENESKLPQDSQFHSKISPLNTTSALSLITKFIHCFSLLLLTQFSLIKHSNTNSECSLLPYWAYVCKPSKVSHYWANLYKNELHLSRHISLLQGMEIFFIFLYSWNRCLNVGYQLLIFRF